jgi:SAM-dependent methyltransferase
MNKKDYRKRIYDSYVSLRTGQQFGNLTPYHINLRDMKWRVKKHLPKNKEVQCLDIACGPGYLLYFLKQNGYKNTVGVDISPEQVTLAKQVCDEVYESDIFTFLSSSRQHDVITIFSFIEHLTKEEAMEFLDKIYGILRPGGRIIILTPNADSPFAAHMRYMDPTHEVIYGHSSLDTILRVCGFINCKAFETGPIPHGVISSIRWILWKVISGMLKYYRLVEGGSAQKWIFTTEFIMVADKPK